GRWGDGEMGRWGDGEMGRWGDGEMGRWGDFGFVAWVRRSGLGRSPGPLSFAVTHGGERERWKWRRGRRWGHRISLSWQNIGVKF
ncbi:hypothetical protein E1H13_11880, partial [Nodosilinea sp. P-1105]|nr:hypothetical protein [Nodosilinea sp. P-1105]